MLRSCNPDGLKQEMWAPLAVCQALRITMTDAIAAVPGADPDRASYQIAVGTAQAMVTQARGVVTGTADLAGVIGRAILANLNPPRRPRVCARVKSPLSRWNKHPPGKPPYPPADREDHHHHLHRTPADHDTQPAIRDNRPKPLTPQHCV